MRGRIFWLAMAALSAAFLAWMWSGGYWLFRQGGRPRVADFTVIWTASHLVLTNGLAVLYDGQAFHALEVATFHQDVDKSLLFNYPPTALLFLWPLALLPYVAALIVFEGIGAAIWTYILRRIIGDWLTAIGMALSLGGATISLFQGQNGFYTASLLVGSLVALPHDRETGGHSAGNSQLQAPTRGAGAHRISCFCASGEPLAGRYWRVA